MDIVQIWYGGVLKVKYPYFGDSQTTLTQQIVVLHVELFSRCSCSVNHWLTVTVILSFLHCFLMTFSMMKKFASIHTYDWYIVKGHIFLLKWTHSRIIDRRIIQLQWPRKRRDVWSEDHLVLIVIVFLLFNLFSSFWNHHICRHIS